MKQAQPTFLKRKGATKLGRLSLENYLKENVFLLTMAIIFIFLRINYLNHPLAFDEARILITIKKFLLHKAFDKNFFFHPPLYLLFVVINSLVFGFSEKTATTVSLFFSLISMFILYFLTRDIFNKQTAFWATLIYTTSPLERITGTLVKHDSLLICLLLLAYWFYFRNNFIASGIAFGLAFLTKETAILGLISIIAYAFYEKQKPKVLAQIIGFAFLTSSWWYLFVSRPQEDVSDILDMFFGITPTYGQTWFEPWYFYLAKLPLDLTIPSLGLLLIGLIVYLFIGWKRRQYLFPLIFGFCVFFFYSLSYGKPYWMTYISLPALAMIAGFGADYLINKAHQIVPAVRLPLYFFFILAIFLSLTNVYTSQEELAHKQQFFLKHANQSKEFVSSVTQTPLKDQREAGLFLKSVLTYKDRIGVVLNEPLIIWYSGIDPKKVRSIEVKNYNELEQWVKKGNETYLVFFAPHFDKKTYQSVSKTKKWKVITFGRVYVLKKL